MHTLMAAGKVLSIEIAKQIIPVVSNIEGHHDLNSVHRYTNFKNLKKL